jgi:hypothetical protein
MAVIVKILVDEFIIKPNQVPVKNIEEHAEALISERQWNA